MGSSGAGGWLVGHSDGGADFSFHIVLEAEELLIRSCG